MKTEADNGMFKSAGMKRANARDQQVSKGKQFGIGNFFSWAMKKYPKLTLGQLEMKMPSLEREYASRLTRSRAGPWPTAGGRGRVPPQCAKLTATSVVGSTICGKPPTPDSACNSKVRVR